MDNQQNPNLNPVPNEQPTAPAEPAPQAQTPPLAAPEPEPSSPAPQKAPPTTNPPKQSSLVLWIVTFLIVAVLVGGYLISARDRGYWPFPEMGDPMEDEVMMEEGGEVMEEDKTADLTYQSSDPAVNFSFTYPDDWRILEEDLINHPIDPNRSVLFLGLIGPVLELTVQVNNPGSGGYTITDPTQLPVSTVQDIQIDVTKGFIEPMGGIPTESETGEERIWISQFEAAGNEYTFTFINLSGEDVTDRVVQILSSFELHQ